VHRESTDHFVGCRSTLVVKAVELAKGDVYLADNRPLGFAESSPAHCAHFTQPVREGASL
jgi:hypothetical protein